MFYYLIATRKKINQYFWRFKSGGGVKEREEIELISKLYWDSSSLINITTFSILCSPPVE